jgi:hypothetical protein
VSQQIAVPGNWTIQSVTKLAAAIGGEINYEWVPFPPFSEIKPQAKTVAAPPEEPPRPFQPPSAEEIASINPEETDEQPVR